MQAIRWIKPPKHYFKLNTDASYKYNQLSSHGGILRNHLGKMIFCFYGPMYAHPPLEAELLAMLIGCRICQIHNIEWNNIILESDSSTIINDIISKNCPSWYHINIWHELLNYCSLISAIKHTFRETNSVADALAHQGKQVMNLTISYNLSDLNRWCRNLIILDQLEIPYIRMCNKVL
jgi:hypothetical protein